MKTVDENDLLGQMIVEIEMILANIGVLPVEVQEVIFAAIPDLRMPLDHE